MSKDIINKLKESRLAKRQELLETITEFNPEAKLADGFDDSILGYDTKGESFILLE